METQLELTSGDRNIPWHDLGRTKEGARNAKEMLMASGLASLVQLVPVIGKPESLLRPLWLDDNRLEPSVDEIPFDGVIEAPGQYLVVRTSDKKCLGIVGSQYQPYDNWRLFQLAENICDSDGGARYDSAGPLDGGRTVWVSVELGDKLVIGGDDDIRKFLVIASSHDGSMKLKVFRSNIRVRCRNTLNLAMQEAPQMWEVAHRGNMEVKVEEVRRTLELSHAYDAEFEMEMNRLIDQSFSNGQFDDFARKLIPSKNRGDAAEQAQMSLIGVQRSSQTMSDTWRETKYGAVQAVAEWVDWFRPRKGATATHTERKVANLWFGVDAKTKNKAMELLRTW